MIFIVIGIVIGLLFFTGSKYHGPNAAATCKKKFYNKVTGKCYRFYIKPQSCPKPRSNFQKILGM